MQGKTQTDLVPVETIDKVPIAMFTGTVDEMCSHSHALEYAKKIGDAVVAVESFSLRDHSYWSYASDEDFMTKLVAQLQTPASEQEQLAAKVEQMFLS